MSTPVAGTELDPLFHQARQLALLLGLSPEHLADERCADAFALRHGRPPMLGDEVPPWRYRGWLRLYVQALHAGCERQTGFPDRWGYLREIMEERRLPERPIPQVSFGLANRSVLKETDDWVGILDGKLGRWESFQKFVRFLAFGLAVSNDDPGLPDDASEALYRKVDLGKWLCHPSDYLGDVAQQRHGAGPDAYFSTPLEVAVMMARLTFGDGDHRLKTVCEPCVGSGGMLLAASNYTLRMAAQDKDEVLLLCCKVNLAVYAPWGLYDLGFLAATQAPADEVLARQRALYPRL